MKDYLKELCNTLKIDLIYNNNKIIVLSFDYKNEQPIIRANKIFKNCPYSVAVAAISYYIDKTNKINREKVLEDYLKQHLESKEFKINDSKFSIKNFNSNDTYTTANTNEDTNSLIEYDITFISVKNFYDSEERYSYTEVLTPSEDDILELNIMIKPPVT